MRLFYLESWTHFPLVYTYFWRWYELVYVSTLHHLWHWTITHSRKFQTCHWTITHSKGFQTFHFRRLKFMNLLLVFLWSFIFFCGMATTISNSWVHVTVCTSQHCTSTTKNALQLKKKTPCHQKWQKSLFKMISLSPCCGLKKQEWPWLNAFMVTYFLFICLFIYLFHELFSISGLRVLPKSWRRQNRVKHY